MKSNKLNPQNGLISSSVIALFPLIQISQGLGLVNLLDKIALKIIQFYQHHLSPHKGFSCAHKAFHGGDSCSQYFHTTIQQQGLAEAIPKLQQRLRDCKTANILLHAEKQHKRDSSKGFCADMSCYGCGCDTPDCDLDTPDCDGCDMPDCGGCDIPCDCSF